MFKAILSATSAAAALAAAAPANAAVIVNPDSSVTVNNLAGSNEFTVNFVGRIDPGQVTTNLLSAVGVFTFTGLTNGGLTYNFSYVLTNTSIRDADLRALGFNLTPDVASAANVSATGFFQHDSVDANFPVGLGNRDVCLRSNANGNCTGGGGGLNNDDLDGVVSTFALTYASAQSSISLRDFAVRFQSIDPDIGAADSGAGVGTPMIPIPEPATWAMMIAGFGLVGSALRSRRKAIAAA